MENHLSQNQQLFIPAFARASFDLVLIVKACNPNASWTVNVVASAMGPAVWAISLTDSWKHRRILGFKEWRRHSVEVPHVSLFSSLSMSTFILTALGVSEEAPGHVGDGSEVFQVLGLGLQVNWLNINLRFCGKKATTAGDPLKPRGWQVGFQKAPPKVFLNFSLF